MSDEVEVPVLGKIAAGTPVEAIQNEVSRIPYQIIWKKMVIILV